MLSIESQSGKCYYSDTLKGEILLLLLLRLRLLSLHLSLHSLAKQTRENYNNAIGFGFNLR